MARERKVQVDTTRLRDAANKMDEVGRTTHDIVTTLRNTLNANGDPWGHDEYGDKFVKGDKGYGKSHDNLLTGGDNMSDSAAKFGKGMRDAATKMDNMDSGK